MRRWKLGFVAVASAAVLVAAMAGSGAGAAAKSTKVKVILSEWIVKPRPKAVQAGKVTFVAKNVGSDVHELEIFKGDDPSALPTNADGSVDTKAIAADEVGEIEDVEPGKTKKATFRLTPGTYVLICNIVEKEADGEIENHFAEGMHTIFKVKGK